MRVEIRGKSRKSEQKRHEKCSTALSSPREENPSTGIPTHDHHRQPPPTTMPTTQFVPPEQTIAIKGIRDRAALKRVREAVCSEANPRLGLHDVQDKDPTCAGYFLLYANYDCGRQCMLARDRLQQMFDDRMPSSGMSVFIKSEMQTPAFAVFVGNVVASRAEIATYFSKFGRLHPCTPVASAGDTAVFVNYLEYESACAVLAADEQKELRLQGSVMFANPGRNTTFVDHLVTTLRNARKFSFTVDEATEIANKMSTQQWPPKSSDVAKLCRAVPGRFAFDRTAIHLIDRQASPAPMRPRPLDIGDRGAANGGEDARHPSPPRTASEERACKRRLRAVNDLVHDNFELLQTLFLELWRSAKGSAWEDSCGGLESSSLTELQEELCRQDRSMLAPLADWDLSKLCTALTARSLKAKLEQWTRAFGTCSPRHDDTADASRFRVLVDEKIVTLEDLEEKYAACFLASMRAPQAVQTIRFVRNILSHRGGSVKGLSEESFEVLFGLTKEAFQTLAQVLSDSHPGTTARFHERCEELLRSAGDEGFLSAEASWASSVTSSSDSSSDSSSQLSADDTDLDADDALSASSTECIRPLASWSKEEVLSFFQRCNFPTAGVDAGEIDGGALLELYKAEDALELFTAPAPDGLGFTRLMFRGKFKSEMAKLKASEDGMATLDLVQDRM